MSSPRKDPVTNQDSKLPAITPSIKDTIPNQDSKIIITQQDRYFPPILAKYPTGYKPLFNDTNDPNKTHDNLNDSTDNSRTEIDYYLNKLNVIKDEDREDESKNENSQALNSNERKTSKTESE